MLDSYLKELQKITLLEPAEERALWIAYKEKGDLESRGRLIEQYQPLVFKEVMHWHDIQPMVENLLIGLPVDSLDWANGVVKSVLENELTGMLPEFYPHIVITPGIHTEVQIYLMPQLPVIRNVNVILDAENLPKVIFLNTRKNIEQKYAGLEGLPITFVRRHERDILTDLQKTLAKQWVIKQYKLRVIPTVAIGENLEIHLKSETDFYDIQAGAYIDMNRNDKYHNRNISDEHTVIMAHAANACRFICWFNEKGVFCIRNMRKTVLLWLRNSVRRVYIENFVNCM